jgi:anti-anti-sigma factor
LSLDPSSYLETPFEAHLVQRDGVATLRLVGAFDQSCRRRFDERVDTALGEPIRELTVDLSAVTFIDSSALGMILELWRQSSRVGFELALRSPSRQVARLFTMVGLDRALPIIDGPSEADMNGAGPTSPPKEGETPQT